MPGGLFFPPPGVKVSAPQGNTVEYYRAMAAIFPFGVMTVLIVICFICAQCFGKRKGKAKEHRSPVKKRPPRDPSKPFSAKEELARERVLRTPTGSPETPPSFDYMNFSFGYGNNSMIGEVRSDLEGTYKAPGESPAQTTTPPFARLRPTPPVLFKKDEDKPSDLQDQPDESRSPSPKTLILQGKQMRYGTWIRTDSSTSSGTSDTSQSTMFQMSISDDEAKKAKEEEKKEKERKRILREKKRLKKEMREDQAAIIRQQITRTVKDEVDQMMRESRAIDIPPRKRIEEHPQYQKMVIAMMDENNAQFDETTVLNSAWEKGRMEDFLKKNLGYVVPDHQMGAVGGAPLEDFSTLRYVKEESIEEPEVDLDDTLPLLPKHEQKLPKTGAKGKAAEDLSRYYVKKVVPVDKDEASQHRSARRKISRESGGKGKGSKEDVSQYYVKKVVPVTEAEDEASKHGARRKVPLETRVKGKASEDLSKYYVKKVVPVTEAEDEASQHGARRKVLRETRAKYEVSEYMSQYYVKKVVPITEAEGQASQHHGVRWKSPLETVFTIKASQPQCQHHGSRKKTPLEAADKDETSQPQFQHGAKQKTSLKTATKGKGASAADESQPLLLQHGAGVKIFPETEAKSGTSQPPIHRTVKRISGAKGEASQHHGSRKKTPLETAVKGEASLLQFQHGAEKKTSLKTATKGKAASVADDSQPLLLQHSAGMKIPPKTEANSDVYQPPIHLPVKRVTGAKGDSSQPLLHHHKVHDEAQAVGEKKHKASVDNSQPLFHHYGAGKNYGTMLSELQPMGVFTKKMMDTRVPLVIGKEFEEKSTSETRKVSSKIAEAVYSIEMKRIEDQMIASHLKTTEKDGEQHVVEIHPEPSSSGLIRRKPIPEVEIHQKPSSAGLIKMPSSVVEEGKHVVEIHQDPSSSELRKKPSPVVEGKRVGIHQEPSSSGLKKPSPVLEEDERVVEIHQKPTSAGLIRRKPSPAVDESEHVVEIHQEPSSSELIKRKPSPVVEEDTVVVLSDEDTSSSWEDIAPMQKYVWWPGIGDRKKKGDKKKKYGKK